MAQQDHCISYNQDKIILVQTVVLERMHCDLHTKMHQKATSKTSENQIKLNHSNKRDRVFTISLEVIERYGPLSIIHSAVNAYAGFDQLWDNHQVQQMYLFKKLTVIEAIKAIYHTTSKVSRQAAQLVGDVYHGI